MSPPHYTLGIDIGGTKIAAAIVTDGGHIVGLNQLPTPARGGSAAIIDTTLQAARVALAASPQPVTACGIGTAGTVDTTGTITHSTDALAGWAGTNLNRQFAATLQLPVTVLNDVHATALGESRYGAAAGCRDALIVAIGTGIGGAIIHDSQLITGASGTAGSIGHITVDATTSRRCPCGRWNHLEAYASGPAIESQYSQATGETIRLPAIAARARNGHRQARTVIKAAAELVGHTLGQVVNLLDPDIIVIAGGVAALQDLIIEPILRNISDQAIPGPDRVQLRLSTLGTRAAILGAASVARDLGCDTARPR